jgi:hypothetical protein
VARANVGAGRDEDAGCDVASVTAGFAALCDDQVGARGEGFVDVAGVADYVAAMRELNMLDMGRR